MAVLPFDNQTAEPTLTQEVDHRGARGGARAASACARPASSRPTPWCAARITRYEPDLPVAYTGDEGRTVTVTRRLVQITVSVEILDQNAGKPLWQRSGLLLEGDYEPGREADGRRKALDKLVTNIVEGAQSQW